MSKKAVICVAHCRNLAELIVDQLKFYNLSNGDISILYPDEERNGRKTHHFGYGRTSGTDDVAGAGVGQGQAVGGTLGWIRGIGPLALPGVGAFIAAGPIKAFLSAAGAGTAARGIAGGLIGWGVSESQAKLYEARIRLGQYFDLHAYGKSDGGYANEVHLHPRTGAGRLHYRNDHSGDKTGTSGNGPRASRCHD